MMTMIPRYQMFVENVGFQQREEKFILLLKRGLSLFPLNAANRNLPVSAFAEDRSWHTH
jgi:hypothetical protein